MVEHYFKTKVFFRDERNVVETATTLAPKIKASSRTVQRDLAILQKMGKLSRVGGDSNGRWKVE